VLRSIHSPARLLTLEGVACTRNEDRRASSGHITPHETEHAFLRLFVSLDELRVADFLVGSVGDLAVRARLLDFAGVVLALHSPRPAAPAPCMDDSPLKGSCRHPSCLPAAGTHTPLRRASGLPRCSNRWRRGLRDSPCRWRSHLAAWPRRRGTVARWSVRRRRAAWAGSDPRATP
jgi:hypothetical protein